MGQFNVPPLVTMKTKTQFPVRITRNGFTAKIHPASQVQNGRKYDGFLVVYPLLGKRKRVWRSDLSDAESAAKDACDKITNGDHQVLELNSRDRMTYLRAREPLAPLGIELDVAAREYASAVTKLPDGATLNDAVECLRRQVNARHAGAWRLGGEIALSKPEYLEFARDWTGEAIRQLPEDRVIVAQRAEALLLSQQTSTALPLWTRAVNGEHPPHAVAAQIICMIMSAQPMNKLQDSREEPAVSRAFVAWYRRLVAMGARDTIMDLNLRVETLRPVLPSAAAILDGVIAATREPQTVRA